MLICTLVSALVIVLLMAGMFILSYRYQDAPVNELDERDMG